MFDPIYDFFYRLFLTFTDFMKDMLWWVMDNLMAGVITVLDGFDIDLAVFSPLTYIDAIPEGTKYFMMIVGFNQSMAMIVSAIGIRMLLKMIPFVRVGG